MCQGEGHSECARVRIDCLLYPHHRCNLCDVSPDFASYGKRDHIARHDDRAIVPMDMVDEDGEEVSAPSSRVVAAVLYLSRGWQASYGGAFVDLESIVDGAGTKFVPKFNRLLVFRVPRWHMVEAVKTEKMRRLSIFGWWLAPGVHYDAAGYDDSDGSDDWSEGAAA